jgi:hypothetical protein
MQTALTNTRVFITQPRTARVQVGRSTRVLGLLWCGLPM